MSSQQYTFVNVDEYNAIKILDNNPYLINTLDRASAKDLLNSRPYGCLEFIKAFNPPLSKTEISTDLKGVHQRVALSHFLKNRGTLQDFEDAVQYDGTLLGSIPLARRRVDLVKAAIDSKNLPPFDAIPKKYRQPSHHLCKHYLRTLNSLPADFFDLKNRELLALLRDQFDVSVIIEALGESDFNACVELIKKCARHSAALKWSSLGKFSVPVLEFLVQHADKCLTASDIVRVFPTATTIVNDTPQTQNLVFALAEKLRVPLKMTTLSSFAASLRSPKIPVQANRIVELQSYFTFADAMAVLDALGPITDKVYLDYPILAKFRSEIQLMMI